MKKYFIFILLLLCGWSLAAQTETSGRSDLYRHTPEKQTRLIHTCLKVGFDFNKRTMEGEARITAAPHFYPADRLRLDAKAMRIHEVAIVQAEERKPLRYLYRNDSLNIELDRTYRRDENYTVYIRYTAQPEEVAYKGKRTFSDTKGLYFIDPDGEDPERPTQVWTQGQTEYASCWFPTIDKPNQKSTQEVYITVPDRYRSLSNGLLQGSERHDDGTRTDHWVMKHPHAPYLFFAAAGEFAVVSDRPWRGKVAIDYYVEKGDEEAAKQVFGETAEMLEFFSQTFRYDFPWEKYAQIVVRDFIAGGMENTTAVVHAESAMQPIEVLADRNYWESVIAHEAAHHWFGNLVTNESWANLIVNEAFANYAEYLWKEYKHGRDEADFHRTEKLDEYYAHAGDFDKPAVRFGYEDREDMFDKVSYNKAGAVLHMLRDYLGDEAFFEAVGLFLRRHEFGTAEVHDLRRAFEEVSGKDLNWFFNQWFFGSGHPTVEASTCYDAESKTLSLHIRQTQHNCGFFEFPLEIDLYEGDRPRRHNVWVSAVEENVFTFAAEKRPSLTDINPRGVILMNKGYEKSAEEYRFQYRHAKDFKSRYQAVLFAADHAGKDILLSAVHDPCYHIRIKALSELPVEELSRKELDMVAKIATSDPKNLVRSAAMWTLAATRDKRYLPLFERGLKTHSASVRNAALNGIAQTVPERAKNFLLASKPEELLGDQLLGLLSVIVRHRMDKYLPQLMTYLIYYPFTEEDNPEQALLRRRGYEWAMSLDDAALVEKTVQRFREMKPYLDGDDETQRGILEVLENGLRIKRGLPQTPSVRQQTDLLLRTIEEMKP
ncbi:M1 family metallopeptidase [Tannerella sp.]|uniref:M1 family metallopeptidase n=1 Tax=Tannerella sp. TaxID=2382127 RepID=UPI0026DCE7EC|nr:M1 family metallopeptidase [Tannerella sp.]MDO4704423.1 M1 family metallopeptidase [Tannerella sp.]